MLHYTLNTGHSRESPRSEVSQAAIDLLTPMLAGGEFPIPGTSAMVSVDTDGPMLCALVYLVRGSEEIHLVQIVVNDMDDDDALWALVESEYLHDTDTGPLATCDMAPPKKPASVPWCAITLDLDSASEIEQMEWLGDFERCLAWAWIESRR